MWDNWKGQRRRVADLWAEVPQSTPLRGKVAVAAILVVGVEIPVPAGHSTHAPSPGPQVPLPPRAADSDPLLLSQAMQEYRDPGTAD